MSKEVRESISMAAAPEAVWDVVMDPSRLGEWVTTHDSVRDAPSGTLAAGDSFTQRLKLAGTGFDVRWTVTDCERPARARWEGRGPRGSRALVTYNLAPADGGTRFDYENDFELPGGVLGRVALGLLAAAPGRREARRTLENLKRLVEGGESSRSG
jgi:carbon monoxide dehydrogenase subunit G